MDSTFRPPVRGHTLRPDATGHAGQGAAPGDAERADRVGRDPRPPRPRRDDPAEGYRPVLLLADPAAAHGGDARGVLPLGARHPRAVTGRGADVGPRAGGAG